MTQSISCFFLMFVLTCSGTPTAMYGKGQSRIIGGDTASDGGHPYMASIHSSDNFHMCGGSIIGIRTIMTAAHCVAWYSSWQIFVLVGSNQLNSGGTAYNVEKLIWHPEYNPKSLLNDLGLVIITKDLELSQKVQIIPIGTKYIGEGVQATLTGWGITTYPGLTPNDLQAISLKTISEIECRDRLTGIGMIFSSSLCTLNKQGEGACHGDSGSPLVHEGTVIGIVSWGSPCAKGLPDVYCRVSYFEEWIEENKV